MKLAIQTIIMGVLIFNIDIVQGSDHQKINELKAGASSGYEGREELLGRAISVVLKSLNESEPYQHDVNDALIKMILTTIQFAKNHNMIDQLIENEVEVTRPLLERVKRNYEKTGDLESVMVGMIDRTACSYQLFLDIEKSDGQREWTSPFALVLENTVRLGQHDLTEEEVHNIWIKKRFNAFAEVIGVELDISDIQENGLVSVRAVNTTRLVSK
jgi:hypothetical protein